MAGLIGLDAAETAFLEAWKSGRMHHAWLLAGPQSMGKAAFAARAARFLVTHGPAGSGEAASLDDGGDVAADRLYAAGNHPEILVLNRQAKDKDKGKSKAKDADKDKSKDMARSISIDQVRQMIRRLQMSLSMGSWRVIIIDAVDDLEVAGANALLKTLEEPPAKTLFLLVSHSPGKLLPTIRSRCRLLRFQPVPQDGLESWLQAIRPMLDRSDVRAIAAASGGVPGKALALIDSDVAAIEEKLLTIARTGDPQNILRAELSKSVAGVANREKLELVIDLVPSLIANVARKCPISALGPVLAQWDAIHQSTRGAIAGSYDGAMIGFAIGNILAELAPHFAPDAR
jgi:DNA polymerase III subunit delta'